MPPQCLNHQGKCWSDLFAIRVIQVIPRKSRPPILQHRYELTRFDMRLHDVQRHKGKAHAVQCRLKHQERVVERGLAAHAHVDLLSAFLEVPGIQAAMRRRRQAQIDAMVLGLRASPEHRRGVGDSIL